MKRPFYSIVSNKGETEGRINIYGVIGPDWYGDGNEAKKFINDLSILENSFNRINIHINSPGGSIWDGLPIFNAIRASKKDIHTYVDGIAFSMGAMIALAGHTVHAAKGSLLMLHNASGMSWGNAKDMRSSAEMLDKHDIVLAQLIADKTGKSVNEVNALWMNYDDNFLTASEALELKLVDVLEDYTADDMPENAQNLSLHQVAAYYNERNEEPNPSLMKKIISGVKAQLTNTQKSDMNTKNLTALSGIENPTDEQLVLANADLSAIGVTHVTLVPEAMIAEAQNVTAERDSLKLANANLNTQLKDANTAKNTAESSLTAANTKIEGLEAKITAFGQNSGAIHKNTGGDDIAPDLVNDDDVDAILNSLPHNQNADRLLG